MDINQTSQMNREAWNEAAEYHRKGRGEALRKGFANPEFSVFTRPYDGVLLEQLSKIGFRGKTIAQLPYNNGRELISLLRLGAGRAVGFDISDAAIAEARELAQAARADIQFMRTDILSIDRAFDGLFDFIYISEGSLQWFASLDDYFAVVARLLKPGGQALIFEMHPFAYFFERIDGGKKPITLDDFPSSFEPGPFTYARGMDYVSGKEYDAKECRWFLHQFSGIITALSWNGLAIESMHEYEFELAENKLLAGRKNLPLSYIIQVRTK
jgi:SAM-dependent methyltransferase